MRSPLPSSLTGRLIVTAVALVAVVSILVTISATLVMRSYLTDQLDDKVNQALSRAEFRAGQNMPEPPDGGRGGQGFGRDIGSLEAAHTGTTTVGTVVVSGNGGGPRDLSSSAIAVLDQVEPDGKTETVSLPGLGSYRVAATTTTAGDVVWQGLPTRDMDDTISSLIWWESLLALAGIAAAAVAGRVLVRRQLRPLRDVAATAHQVTAMPLSSGEVGETVRVPDNLTDPSTEVGQVGEALNQLLGHVEQALDARHESEQQVRQFLADA
ncbi:MAG: HAMP domain-containing protein, partial [Aeromicrobium sp.]